MESSVFSFNLNMEFHRLRNILLLIAYSFIVIAVYEIAFFKETSNSVKNLQEENQEIRFFNSEQKRQLDALNKEITQCLEVKALNEKLNADIEESKKSRDQLSSETKSLQEEKSKLQEQMEQLKNDQDELQEKLRVAQNLTDEQASTISRLEGQLNEQRPSAIQEPTLEYENYRRRVGRNIVLYWDYFISRTDIILTQYQNESLLNFIADFVELSRQYKILWINDLEQMRIHDGYESWRYQESQSLRQIIQKRFDELQNPSNCDSAEIVKCYPYYLAGWGVTIHHVVECMLIGHVFNRTMVFNSTGFQYNRTAGFQMHVEPFSRTCTETPVTEEEEKFDGVAPHKRIIKLDEDTRYLVPNYTARLIPADLAPRLMKLSSEPLALFNAIMVDYAIHYVKDIQEMVAKKVKEFKIQTPIVGIHVRRTDRLAPERYVALEHYMDFVEDYYDKLEINQKVDKRRVFLASESPYVIKEMKSKFPDYEIISNEPAAKRAERWATRFSTESLLEMFVDLHILALCNLTLCTESSNVCRLLHEYQQLKHPDSIFTHKSLDTLYFADYENDRFGNAILDHEPFNNEEIELQRGDPLKLNYMVNQNGLYEVTNGRTNKTGKVPAFKVEVLTGTFNAPSFYS